MPRADQPPPTTLGRALLGALLLMVALPLAVMVVLALLATDPRAVATVVSRANPWLLALAFAGHFVQYPLMAWRWRFLVHRPLGQVPGMRETVGFVLIAHLFNLIVPGPAGELAGSYVMKVRAGVPMAVGLAAGAYGRLFGMLLTALSPLALALIFALPLPESLRLTMLAGLSVAVVGLCGVGMLSLLPSSWARLAQALERRQRLQGRLTGRLLGNVLLFLQGFGGHARHLAATPGRLLGALGISALILLGNMAAFHGILVAMQVELPFHWGAFLFCVLVLGNISSYAVPASGNVTSPVLSLAAMTALFAVDEASAMGALFLAWAFFIVQGLVAFAVAVPNLALVTQALALRGQRSAKD
jgi:uncharacterized protein (TIRG00374 family)